MSSKRPSLRRIAGFLWRHSFGSNKSSGVDHQIDTDADDPELQRNREEESELSEIPNLTISDPTGYSFTNEKDLSFITPELVSSLYSDDVTIQLEAMQKIRKLFMDTPSLPIEEVIKPETVPRFVHFLEDSRYIELQFESAWVLTKMAFDNSVQTHVVIDAGVVPVLIKLISSSSETVVEQSIWALGNIAADSTECRDLVLNSNVLQPLIGFLNDCNLSLSIMRKATWTLFNLCDKNPRPNFEHVTHCLPLCARLMFNQDYDILVSVSWVLAFLGEGSNEQIQIIIQSGVCPRAVQLLSHSSNKVVLGALHLVCDITTGDGSQALINENVLPALFNLLFHEKESIVENACRTLGNITAGTEQQIQAVIECNLISSLIELLHHGDLQIRQQAAKAIKNATANGAEEQIVYIVEAGAIPSLCKLLSEPDTGLTEDAVSGLENILRIGEIFAKEADSTENPYAVLICNSPEMALDSEDAAIQLEATKRFDKLLETSDVFNLIIDEFIKSGAVQRFVHFLEDSRYPELQFESACVLIDITSGTPVQTQVVIESGAVPVLIKLLTASLNENVVRKSVHAIGNIACYSTESRNLLLKSNVLPPLLGLFKNDNLGLSMMRDVTWALDRLCKKSSPNFEHVSQCLPHLARLLVNEDDDEVLVYVCQALSNLCYGPNEQIQVVIESGVCPRVVQLLSHTSNKVLFEALCLVCNIAAGTDLQTQVIINENILPVLHSLMSHEKESIVENACWTLSNIATAGTEQQMQAVIDANLIPPLIELLHHRDFKIRQQAARAIKNATANGSEEQIVYIVEAGSIPSLCKLLSETDSDLTGDAVCGLENILRTGEVFAKAAGSTENPYAVLICNSPEMLALYSEDSAIQLEATKRFDKLLETSDGLNLIIDEVIKSGAVPRFVHFLEDSRYPELQLVSASVLNSIVCGNSVQTQVVIESGAVPGLIRLLTTSSNENVLRKSVQVLGNIACDSTECRHLVLNSNVLPPLLGLFNNGDLSLSMMRRVTWALSRLCKNSTPNFAQVAQCLPLLTRLMVKEDEDVLFNVCQALFRLCDCSNEQIQVIIDSGVCPRAVQLLSHTSNKVILEALCLVCNITTCTDSQTQVIINSNALPALGSLLSHEDECTVKIACRTLANITSHNGQQVQSLIDANIIPSLIVLLHHRDINIRKEAARAIANATTNGSEEQIEYIVDAGAIAPLCKLLSEADSDLTEEAVCGLANILQTGESMAKANGSTENPFAVLICNSPSMKLALYSEDTAIQLEATKRFRKLLETPEGLNLKIDEVIKSGTVPRFIHFLEDSRYPELQFESASVLTNLACGTSAQTQVIIDAGVVPVLIRLISSLTENVVKQSLWALGNIASGSTESRDLVLNSNVLPPLLGLFNGSNLSLLLMRIAAWTLSCLCCDNPPPNFEQVSQCLPLLARLMVNGDEEILFQACLALSSLSESPNEQIQAVIDSGVCPRAIQLLSHTSNKVVTEAIRLVCNITTGPGWLAQVLNSNAVPALRSLLSHEKESIVENACQTLANITTGNEQQIQAVIDANIVPSLIELLHHRDVSLSIMRSATSTLSRLCKNSRPSFEQVSPCLPLLARLMVNEDATVLENVCWALSRLCEGPNEQIQVVIESGVCPRAVQLLSHTSIWVVKAALRLVCKIAIGDALQTQVLINANALPVLGNLLSHEMESILVYACWTLSNITTSCNEHQIQALIDANIVPSLIVLLHHRDAITRRQVAKTIANATTNGSVKQIVNIVEAGAIPPLCQLLSETDPDLIEDALSGLESILRAGKEISNGADLTKNRFTTFIKQCDGLDKITLLSSHHNVKIAQKAANLVEMYFA